MVWIALAFVLLASSQSQNNAVVEVCLSPGCLADGAQGTLSKLKALAPPASVCVREGKCLSLCGKGPVLIQNPDEKPKHRIILKNMKDEKLVPFLNGLITSNAGESDSAADGVVEGRVVPDDLVEGYDLVDKGSKMFSEKSYSDASKYLKSGIDKAFSTSKEWGADMEWMVAAHRTLAESLLEQGSDYYDEALLSVQTSFGIPSETEDYSMSYELLARICQARNDNEGEYEALKAYFGLPEPSNPPRELANQRRELGFRYEKLQRECGN